MLDAARRSLIERRGRILDCGQIVTAVLVAILGPTWLQVVAAALVGGGVVSLVSRSRVLEALEVVQTQDAVIEQLLGRIDTGEHDV